LACDTGKGVRKRAIRQTWRAAICVADYSEEEALPEKSRKHVWQTRTIWERHMPGLGTILLIVLVLLLLAAVPAWPYSRGWGYFPSGGLGLVLIVVLILVLMGMI
jgi:hypothetical protein